MSVGLGVGVGVGVGVDAGEGSDVGVVYVGVVAGVGVSRQTEPHKTKHNMNIAERDKTTHNKTPQHKHYKTNENISTPHNNTQHNITHTHTHTHTHLKQTTGETQQIIQASVDPASCAPGPLGEVVHVADQSVFCLHASRETRHTRQTRDRPETDQRQIRQTRDRPETDQRQTRQTRPDQTRQTHTQQT